MMTGLDVLFAFVLAYFFTLLLVSLIFYFEMKGKKRFKEWEENKLMLTFLFFQAFLMVVTIFYLAATHPAFHIWLTFVILNLIIFFFAFTEALSRKNVLAIIASVVAFVMLILFGL